MNIDIIRIFAFVFIVMLHTLNRQYGLTVWMSGYAVISTGVNLFISYGRRLLGLRSRACTPSINLPAPGRRHTLYVHFRVSRVLCF